jgi:hypothetical protein
MPPPGTTFETFADRRVALLRGAVRGPLFRPALPAVVVENSETCKVGAGVEGRGAKAVVVENSETCKVGRHAFGEGGVWMEGPGNAVGRRSFGAG